ncbi:Ig-like domain-containing protein [Shimia biformata]|uniref:Ig-like domain-containing protein n=1 Tax=Shimia biformata TaxID=1294299 RepID=UPI00194E0A43|nr:Ig-like domain-containing protein [Shimia biformata]
MARSITFVIEGAVNTEVRITENANGTLTFDIQVMDGGLIGDLRALFFDLNGLVADDGLMVFDGVDVTDTAFVEEGVDTLGRDANIKGQVVNELGEFDVGIEFGTSGMSSDDIQSTSFTLAHDDTFLTLDMIDLADFGLRYTSVGEEGGTRNDSFKVGDQASGVADRDGIEVVENTAGSVDLLANDTNGTDATVIGASDTEGAFDAVPDGFERTVARSGVELGTLHVGFDGIANFDANGAQVDTLALGETVDVYFSYVSEALDGSLASADVVLTVVGTNDAPVLVDGTANAEEGGTPVTVDLTVLGSDIDNDDDGSTLVYTLVGVPAEGTATIASGILSFDPGTDFEDLNAGEIRVVTLTVQATDSHGATTTGTVAITVTGTNGAPSAVADMLEAVEDTGLVIDPLANDTDPDAGDTLEIDTINGVTVVEGATIATDHGMITVGAGGVLNYVPDENYSGTDSFSYTATDGQAASNSATVSINVEAVADTPELMLTGGSAAPGGDLTPVPSGADVQINTTTDGTQTDPSVTALSDGGFVVAWHSYQSGVGYESFFQVFDASGAPVGGEVQISSGAGDQRAPDVLALDGGGFIVAYASTGGADGSAYGIYSQRYDASGVAVGPEVLVNTTTSNQQQQPNIAALDGGGYVITWESFDTDGTAYNIYSQSFDINGNPVGAETLIDSPANPEYDTWSAVSGLAGGGYVVTWSNWVPGSGQWETYAQVVDAAGALDGPAIQLNSQSSSIATYSSVLGTPDGGFVVVWSQDNPGENRKLLMSRFDAGGNLLEGEVEVSQNGPTIQHAAGITLLEDGGFMISWSAVNPTDSSGGMFGRRYDAAGNPVSDEFLINDTVAGQQHPVTNSGNRVLTTLEDGTVVSVWGTNHGSGELYFRLIDVPAISDGVAGAPTAIALDAALTDGDGSETLTITLSGFPPGTTFNIGTANGDDWVIENAQTVDLSVLEMVIPTSFAGGTVTLIATARATEMSNGDFAEVSDSISLEIAPADLPPLFTAGDDVVDMRTMTAGSYQAGSQYDAGAGNDSVVLPWDAANAATAGYDLSQVFNGGEGNDSLHGSALGDHFEGGGGRDNLHGFDGNDTLNGGDGNDFVAGGEGDDVMDGGAGIDILSYQSSLTGITLNSGLGTATGEGNDSFQNFESYRLSQHVDYVTGSASDEVFRLYGGDDVIDAGGGNDQVLGGAGDDTMDGGAGRDLLNYALASGAVTVDLAAGIATGAEGNDVISNFEVVYGSNYDDLIIGDDDTSVDGWNTLLAQGGNDTVYGGAGNDWLEGQNGDDQIFGEEGDDLVHGGAGSDLMDGGAGTDRAYYADMTIAVNVDLSTGIATQGTDTDTLVSIENVTGSAGNDTITGDAGDNEFTGWTGDDLMTGGGGADVFHFDLRGTTDWGDDRITDFEIGIDKISLFGSAFSTLGDLNAQQIGGDVVLDLGNGTTLTLENSLLGDLSDSDFVF